MLLVLPAVAGYSCAMIALRQGWLLPLGKTESNAKGNPVECDLLVQTLTGSGYVLAAQVLMRHAGATIAAWVPGAPLGTCHPLVVTDGP